MNVLTRLRACEMSVTPIGPGVTPTMMGYLRYLLCSGSPRDSARSPQSVEVETLDPTA